MDSEDRIGPIEDRWREALSERRAEGCLEAEALVELAERGRRARDYGLRMDHVSECRFCRAALRDFRRVEAGRSANGWWMSLWLVALRQRKGPVWVGTVVGVAWLAVRGAFVMWPAVEVFGDVSQGVERIVATEDILPNEIISLNAFEGPAGFVKNGRWYSTSEQITTFKMDESGSDVRLEHGSLECDASEKPGARIRVTLPGGEVLLSGRARFSTSAATGRSSVLLFEGSALAGERQLVPGQEYDFTKSNPTRVPDDVGRFKPGDWIKVPTGEGRLMDVPVAAERTLIPRAVSRQIETLISNAQRNPGDSQSWMGAARLLVKYDQIEAARYAIEQSLRLDRVAEQEISSRVKGFIHLIKEELKNEPTRRAVELFEKSDADWETDTRENREKCLKMLQDAIDLWPRPDWRILHISRSFEGGSVPRDQWPDRINELKDLVAQLPTWWSYEKVLAVMRMTSSCEQDWQNHRKMLLWVAEAFKAVPQANMYAGGWHLYYKDGFFAAQAYERAIAVVGKGGLVDHRSNYARSLWLCGHHDTCLEQAGIDPLGPDAWPVWLAVGEYTRAMHALAYDPSPDSYQAARVYLMANQRDDARTLLNQCINDKSQEVRIRGQAKIELAELLMESDYSGAIIQANEGRTLINQARSGWFELQKAYLPWQARTARVLGDLDKAIVLQNEYLDAWTDVESRDIEKARLTVWQRERERR